MKLVRAAVFGLGLMGMAGIAAAQNTNPDAINPAAPGTHNPATKPIDETFRNPIPDEQVLPTVRDWGGLRPDYGREETYYFCSPCHSEARIRTARKTREDWAATIDRIMTQYPYEKMEPEEREIILDYLAKQYGPQVP